MKLMTYNTQHCLNYITREIDFDLIAGTIKKYGADIIGLNEMNSLGSDEEYTDQMKELASRLGFHYYFGKACLLDGGNPFGNGILSKFTILSVENIPIPDPEIKNFAEYYETRNIIKATFENSLTVMVTHFGLNADEQVNAVKTVLANLPNNKTVLMGDFNIRPDNILIRTISKHLVDTATVFDGIKYSFPSDSPNRKIDYIFVSDDIKIISADIPQIVTSDHCPHIAEIDI